MRGRGQGTGDALYVVLWSVLVMAPRKVWGEDLWFFSGMGEVLGGGGAVWHLMGMGQVKVKRLKSCCPSRTRRLCINQLGGPLSEIERLWVALKHVEADLCDVETLVEHTTDLDSYGLSLTDSLCSAFEKVSIFRERQIPEKLQWLLASAGRGQSGRNVWRHGERQLQQGSSCDPVQKLH